jgi:hypothetical protein
MVLVQSDQSVPFLKAYYHSNLQETIPTDRVPVIALINLGRNVLGAPLAQLLAKIQPFPQIACPPNRRLEQPPSDYSRFQRNGSLRSAYAEAIEP